MNDRTSIVMFLAGGVTGAAITLLLAPQSGSANRVQEAGSALAGHPPRRARGNGDEVAAT
jgi:gas vesicle protein